MAGSRGKADKLKALFLETYAGVGVIGHACAACKIPRSTFELWKHSDPEFKAALDLAEQQAVDVLEREAQRRAVAGSDVLLIFLLKGNRPAKYRDQWKGELTGGDGGPLVVQLVRFAEEKTDAVD